MKTVYDEEGNPFTVDPVDAREYVETGRFFVEPPVKDKPETVSSTPKKKTPIGKVKDGKSNTSSENSK